MEQVTPTPADQSELTRITAELAAHVASTAAKHMPHASAVALGDAVDSGERDLFLTCRWGVGGMHVRLAAIDADGVGVVLLDYTEPPVDADEDAPPPGVQLN